MRECVRVGAPREARRSDHLKAMTTATDQRGWQCVGSQAEASCAAGRTIDLKSVSFVVLPAESEAGDVEISREKCGVLARSASRTLKWQRRRRLHAKTLTQSCRQAGAGLLLGLQGAILYFAGFRESAVHLLEFLKIYETRFSAVHAQEKGDNFCWEFRHKD